MQKSAVFVLSTVCPRIFDTQIVEINFFGISPIPSFSNKMMHFHVKIQEINGFPQIIVLSVPLMFIEVLNLLLTPLNRLQPQLGLNCKYLFIMGLSALLDIQTRNG